MCALIVYFIHIIPGRNLIKLTAQDHYSLKIHTNINQQESQHKQIIAGELCRKGPVFAQVCFQCQSTHFEYINKK